MKIDKIKPIPRYIVNSIIKKDKQIYKGFMGSTRYYSYLALNDSELTKVTVAVKYKNKKFYYKQVAVHGINSSYCFVKDMCLNYISGYTTGWYSEKISKYPKWYETSTWCEGEAKYFNPFSILINSYYLKRLKQYKYSAYELYRGTNLLHYLKLYKVYPFTEYLLKSGLNNIAESITILKTIEKDKNFSKWLIQNKKQLSSYTYYIDIIIKAYKLHKNIDILQREKEIKLKYQNSQHYRYIKECFDSISFNKLLSYIIKNNINLALYYDYIKACKYINLDISLSKNYIPHNFMYWHDVRIDEYNTLKALNDEKKRKELYDRFFSIAKKYITLENYKKDNYVVIIAKSPDELINEGEILHHCVGKMNYDQKFIKEESLIFFIRNKSSIDIPYVTLEYSINTKKILQCYGEKDSKPNENVLNYVNKIWLPYANRKIKQIAV